MLLKCPNCGSQIRMTTPDLRDKIVTYFCLGCDKIVRLDLVSDEIQTSSATTRPPVAHASRILVVDDAASFLRIAEHLLNQEGYVVITAHDGMDALKKITDEHPDVILLDLFMPKMSGFEVLRALKTNSHYKSFKNIPVLVTSGTYNQAEGQLLHDLGASGFISKESIPEFLAYRIKRLLERPEKTA